MMGKFKKKLAVLSLVVLASISFTGCSVMMAASGKKEPNLSVVRKNNERFQIEAELGTPKQVNTLENGEIECIYTYSIGAEPSVGRAAVWLTADIFLLFIPELFTTPYEAARGEKKSIKVIYNEDDEFLKATMG